MGGKEAGKAAIDGVATLLDNPLAHTVAAFFLVRYGMRKFGYSNWVF